MKVNLFQQASREARQRTARAALKADRNAADVYNSQGAFGYQRGAVKRERSNRTAIRAGFYMRGEPMAAPNPRIMNGKGRRRGTSAGYRAPATRLY